jgi:hypothetical protein
VGTTHVSQVRPTVGYHPSATVLLQDNNDKTTEVVENKQEGHDSEDIMSLNDKIASLQVVNLKLCGDIDSLQTSMQINTKRVDDLYAMVDSTDVNVQSCNLSVNQFKEKIHHLTILMTDLRRVVGELNAKSHDSSVVDKSTRCDDIWVFAVSKLQLDVFGDDKETPVKGFDVKAGEKVLLSYPVQPCNDTNSTWIQIRRLSENFDVKFYWIKLLESENMNFEHFSSTRDLIV